MYIVRVNGRKRRRWKSDLDWNAIFYGCCIVFGLFFFISTILLLTNCPIAETDEVSSFLYRSKDQIPGVKISRTSNFDSQTFESRTERKKRGVQKNFEISSTSRVTKYCHGKSQTLGMEGFVPEDFVLQQMHIIVSPGVTSTRNLPNCSQESHHLHHLANDTFRLLQEGHLQNTFQNIPSARSAVHCMRNELSPFGALHLHQLGEFLQKAYMERWNIETSKAKPKHFKLHSLDNAASLSSLLSLLHGMLPKQLFHNAHIQKLTENLDVSTKYGSLHKQCNFLQDLNLKLDKCFSKNETINFNRLISEKSHVMKDFHYLMTDFCSSLSESNSDVTSVSHVSRALHLIDKSLYVCSRHKHFQELADLHTFPWIKEFIKNTKAVNRVFEKVFVYSADNSFISYLLTSIRYPKVKVTYPGSRIIFELYKNIYDKIKPYYVRILYNGQDISHSIPLCSKDHIHGLCKLKYFVDFQRHKYKTLFQSSPNLGEKCNFEVL